MDPTRFDTISRLFASRKHRAGLDTRALAQDGTPQVATPAASSDDPHPSADDAQPDPEFLFVQPFDGGTWAPKDGEDGVYTLTLTGAAAQTVYFSDRPERIVGLAPTQQFLDTLGFTPDNPPNAALVADTATGEQDVLVVELLNPSYVADTATLTYDARVLTDYGEAGLAHLAQQQTDYELDASFGDGSLFIDGPSCSDTDGICYTIIDGEQVHIGTVDSIGCCAGKGVRFGCGHCSDDFTGWYYGRLCAEAYPDQCSYTTDATSTSWDCFITGVSDCSV